VRPCSAVKSTLGWVLVLTAFGSTAAAPVAIEKRTRITAEIRPLTAGFADERDALHATLVLDSEEPRETRLRLAWPEETDVSTLVMRAERGATPTGAAHSLELDARLTLPDGSTVHATRSVAFDEETTALFEIYRYGQRSLTVAIAATARTELVVEPRRAPGAQVRFRVEIVRVDQGRQLSLEDNYLDTLVGESVGYSFRLAETSDAAAVSITLKPTRLHADIAEIDIEISGKLPLEDDLVVVGRTEHWLASRGATSTLAFEAGEPPTGYRFLITARF